MKIKKMMLLAVLLSPGFWGATAWAGTEDDSAGNPEQVSKGKADELNYNVLQAEFGEMPLEPMQAGDPEFWKKYRAAVEIFDGSRTVNGTESFSDD